MNFIAGFGYEFFSDNQCILSILNNVLCILHYFTLELRLNLNLCASMFENPTCKWLQNIWKCFHYAVLQRSLPSLMPLPHDLLWSITKPLCFALQWLPQRIICSHMLFLPSISSSLNILLLFQLFLTYNSVESIVKGYLIQFAHKSP